MAVSAQGLIPSKTPWGQVLLAALPAALHAVIFLGRLHPDEVYQSLEPAMSRAFGFGVVAWEWQAGLRNTSVPIFFSWLLKAAAAVGINDVLGRRLVIEVPQYALHAAMLGAVWRLFERRVEARLASAGMFLMAAYGPLIWFGGRTMSESFSVAFLAWGLERLDSEERAWHVPLSGGLLLGCGEVMRYGSAAVIAPAMLWLLLTRRFRAFAFATLGGLFVGFLLGWLDLASWGEWFHSFRAYVTFNVLSGKSAEQFGALPWWYYLQRLVLAPWAPVGFFAWRARPRTRAWLFLVAAAGYFVIVSATAHKEDRFLYPTLILASIAAMPGFLQWLADAWPRPLAKGVAVLVALGTAAFFVVKSPWEPERKEQYQLEVKASRDATGLVLMNEGMWGSGGFFYLGKNVPWCPCDFPADPCFQMAITDRRINRGLYWSNSDAEAARDAASRRAFESAGFRLIETRGRASLFARDP